MEVPVSAYTVAQFCNAYGVSPSFFYREVREGRLNPRKARGRTLVSADEARRWFDDLPNYTEGSSHQQSPSGA